MILAEMMRARAAKRSIAEYKAAMSLQVNQVLQHLQAPGAQGAQGQCTVPS